MRNIADLSKITPKERGYLIGFYIGDGNIFEQNSSGIYRLRYFLGLKEKPIQESLVEILSKLFANIRTYDGQGNTIVIEIHSKQFITWVKNNCTKDGIKNKSSSKRFKIGVIEGLIDSDGYVQRNYVEITTVNEKLRKNIIEILSGFKTKPNVRSYSSPISGRTGWRVGFSLKNGAFKPTKWVLAPQTAENAA